MPSIEEKVSAVSTKVDMIHEQQKEVKASIEDLVKCIKGNGEGKGIIARLSALKTHVNIQWFIIASGMTAVGSKLLNLW